MQIQLNLNITALYQAATFHQEASFQSTNFLLVQMVYIKLPVLGGHLY